jgi:hypothetical protein
MIEHNHAQIYSSNTGVLVVDFNSCLDMSYTHVKGLSYKGQKIAINGSWRKLYITLLKMLYADYSNEIDSIVGKIYGRDLAPLVVDYSLISSLRYPGEFASDRYVELNKSATRIIETIKMILDICDARYEDVNIYYVKGAKTQNELSSKGQVNVQNSQSKFSNEMLDAAKLIISKSFPNGLRKSSSIARKRFVTEYKNITCKDFPENIDLDELARLVGLEYEGKIYVILEGTKKYLKGLIDNIQNENYHIVYYEELYKIFSQQVSADQIYSTEMLKIVLEAVVPGMAFYKKYACFSKSDSLADEIISAYGNDTYIDYNEIKKRLPYVSLDQIRNTCSNSPKFVSMGNNKVYALSDKINLDERDVENAKISVEEDIIENNFSKLGSIDVYESECMNPGINASALQSLLFDRYLSKDYERKRSIITRRGTQVSIYEEMEKFCSEHEQISISEIEAYERDISGRVNYGLSVAFDNMIRVNKDTFVCREMVSFDVEAIDYAISTYVQDDVFPLADIKSFTSFPYVDSFPWNSFLLDSFCRHYSKKYRSMGGPAKMDIIGAIYPIEMSFDNYTSLLAKVAADSGLELTENTIKVFFSDHKYCLKKNKLDEILAIAQRLRLKEE